jgi:hypothetical protein
MNISPVNLTVIYQNQPSIAYQQAADEAAKLESAKKDAIHLLDRLWHYKIHGTDAEDNKLIKETADLYGRRTEITARLKARLEAGGPEAAKPSEEEKKLFENPTFFRGLELGEQVLEPLDKIISEMHKHKEYDQRTYNLITADDLYLYAKNNPSLLKRALWQDNGKSPSDYIALFKNLPKDTPLIDLNSYYKTKLSLPRMPDPTLWRGINMGSAKIAP